MRLRVTLLAIGLSTPAAACSEPTGPEREISGARLYEQNCARCHGPDGKGVEGQQPIPDFSDRAYMDRRSSMAIRQTIRMGKPPRMPSFGREFTEASVKVLEAHIRSLSGSQGPHGPRPQPAAQPSAGAEPPAP